MTKKVSHSDDNLYYINGGQAQKEYIDEKMKRKKEREKRIKQNKAKREDNFDIDTETVIQMTNKNNRKIQEEKRKKITKEEKKRKKRKRKVKFILKIVLLLGIIVGAIIFAMVSPIFNIKEIQVTNNNQISAETIISLSKLKTGENIFKFNSIKTIEKIKENPYVEDAIIQRSIPNKIQIIVEERSHDYSVDFLGKYAYINKKGYILEIADDKKEKIVIQGITTRRRTSISRKSPW